MPLPLKFVSVPPLTLISDNVKSVTLSLITKVMVAVLPKPMLLKLLVMAIVGGVRSMV